MRFYVCVVAIFVAVLSSLCFVSEAALARAIYRNSAYPGKCAIDENLILSPGESAKAPINPCAGIKCLHDSHVEYRTCEAKAPPKGCKQRDFVNTKRPFPECCERAYDCTREI